MTEKRWLYFALGVTTVISIGAVTNQLMPLAPATGLTLSDAGITFPDGTVQTTAAPADPRREFYLTVSYTHGAPDISGTGPLKACAPGFHFASLWEIANPSTLRYAFDRPDAFLYPDSGQGAPSAFPGWIRTGHRNLSASSPGEASCLGWSTTDSDEKGTVVHFPSVWDQPATQGALVWGLPYATAIFSCLDSQKTWCVEDYPGAGG